MFRRDFQQAADVMRRQFFQQIFRVRLPHEQIVTNAGTDRDAGDAVHAGRLAQQVEPRSGIEAQIRTQHRKQAAFPPAIPRAGAFDAVHVRRRPANIGDMPRKIGRVRHPLDFAPHRFRAAADNPFPLMQP